MVRRSQQRVNKNPVVHRNVTVWSSICSLTLTPVPNHPQMCASVFKLFYPQRLRAGCLCMHTPAPNRREVKGDHLWPPLHFCGLSHSHSCNIQQVWKLLFQLSSADVMTAIENLFFFFFFAKTRTKWWDLNTACWKISTFINQYLSHFAGLPQLLKVQRFIAIVLKTLQKLAFYTLSCNRERIF